MNDETPPVIDEAHRAYLLHAYDELEFSIDDYDLDLLHSAVHELLREDVPGLTDVMKCTAIFTAIHVALYSKEIEDAHPFSEIGCLFATVAQALAQHTFDEDRGHTDDDWPAETCGYPWPSAAST
jgi:hypothetical protein